MKPVLLWLSLSLFCLPVFAQITIKGVITDQNKAPIPGVNIIELGTQNGVSSDANGAYAIQVKDQNAMLSFSFIGFYDESIQVGSKTTLNIMLRPNSELLDEVVVTALGLERDPKNLGYVVQKLETKQVSEVKSPNFVDNLAGQVAGVTVSQGATGVGSSSKITIRGEASFTNNNPLFVVDGVPINNNAIINYTTDAASGFQEIDFGNGAMEVNPDDIASVSVLKGPAAAALYGTRASNGVILIETKSGAVKQGIGVSINSSTFVDRAFKLPEFQNKYGQGNSGEFEYVNGLGGGVNDAISYSYGPQLDAGILVPQYDSPVTMPDGSTVRGGDNYVHGGLPITPTEFVSHPDNLKNFYQTGYTTMNNAAVTSGFDKGDFRLSFTDMRSESIIPGVNLDRQTVSSRLNFRPTSKLKISTSLSYINSASDNRPANGYGSENV
ncbi:MAG: TonB-dependent receptor plug domain-containing protein, partial [Salibacteraceae bacterium]|nr:TonB-dependent receptor plug domain-containing protein [Salibacteraceae bacterium]